MVKYGARCQIVWSILEKEVSAVLATGHTFRHFWGCDMIICISGINCAQKC